MKELINEINKLQKENETLKSELDSVKTHFDTYIESEKHLEHKNKKLQSRIDKAIKYIEETSPIEGGRDLYGNMMHNYNLNSDEIRGLLSILKGDEE